MGVILRSRHRRAFGGFEPCDMEVDRFCYVEDTILFYHACGRRAYGFIECPYPARYCRVWCDKDMYGDRLP